MSLADEEMDVLHPAFARALAVAALDEADERRFIDTFADELRALPVAR